MDAIDGNVAKIRLEDLRVFKQGVPTKWKLEYESHTKASLGVFQGSGDLVTRVIFCPRKSFYVVVSNRRGIPNFTYTEAPTCDEAVRVINQLLQPDGVSHSGL